MGCGRPMSLRPIQINTPTPKFTANCETKNRDRRSPASLITKVVSLMSVPPAMRMKRSRKASRSSSTNTSTTRTMPAVSIGTQMDPTTFSISCKGLDGASCTSTGMGAGAEAPSGLLSVGGGAVSGLFSTRSAWAVSELTRLTVRLFNASILCCSVLSYLDRLPVMPINCAPMTVANRLNDSTKINTAVSTEPVWPNPSRRNARTRGAIKRLKMMARVTGTSTSRAKYSSASTVAAAITPKARSRFEGAGGSRTGESMDVMRYFGTAAGESAALTATKMQQLILSANDARFGPDHQKPPAGNG